MLHLDPKKKTVCYLLKYSWLNISKMYNQQADAHDFSIAMAFVLLHIHPEKGTAMASIAELMGTPTTSMVRLFNNMEQQKLIVRVKNNTDKRLVHVQLTPKGNEAREVAKAKVKAYNQIITDQIEPSQLAIFLNVLQQINEITESQIQKNETATFS